MSTESLPLPEIAPQPEVENLPDMTFTRAASMWLETRKGYIVEQTVKEYGQSIRNLKKKFGPLHLCAITASQVNSYQQERKASGVQAGYINKETSVLQQILKWAKVWHAIAPDYEPLRLSPHEKEGPGRALTDQEDKKFFQVAFSKPRWAVAAHVLRLSKNTSCGFGEIRHLRLKDILLKPEDGTHPKIFVQPEGAKNDGRVRSVPLNSVALEDAMWLYARALKKGCSEPEHYVLPFRPARNRWDPTRPASCWAVRTPHGEICEAAGIKIRVYDMRHTAISLLLRNPRVSREHAKMVAGHIGERMFKRYFHGDIEQMAVVMEDLARKLKIKRPANEQSEPADVGAQLLSLLKTAVQNGSAPTIEATPVGELPAASSVGSQLLIGSTPSGADIEIAGSFMGNTPSAIVLLCGEHTIVLKKTGFKDWERKIRLTGGKISVTAELQPELPSSMPATAEHAKMRSLPGPRPAARAS